MFRFYLLQVFRQISLKINLIFYFSLIQWYNYNVHNSIVNAKEIFQLNHWPD